MEASRGVRTGAILSVAKSLRPILELWHAHEQQDNAYFGPGLSGEIEKHVSTCETCRMFETAQPKDTLNPHEIPARPWQKVDTILFMLDGK